MLKQPTIIEIKYQEGQVYIRDGSVSSFQSGGFFNNDVKRSYNFASKLKIG